MLLNMVSGFIAVMNRSRMNEVSLVLKSVSVLISSLKEAQKSSAKGEAKTVKVLINVLAVMDVTCMLKIVWTCISYYFAKVSLGFQL